jgi:hypothetical protein
MDPEDLERHLASDLDQVGERFTDVEFSTQLYRALANNRWTKQDELDGSVALSWSRAQRLVNELRERRGAESLVLAQSGGEGRDWSSGPRCPGADRLARGPPRHLRARFRAREPADRVAAAEGDRRAALTSRRLSRLGAGSASRG